MTTKTALVSALATFLAAVTIPPAALGEDGQKLCYRTFNRLLYWWLSLKTDTVQISSSETLAYFDTGPRRSHDPPRPPILLLHGFTADKESWLLMVRRLRKDHRVVAPDLAGHGDSLDTTSGHYGLADQAERAHQLADKLELGEYHVLGHSMGGGVAVALALKYPAEVRSLGLIAPAIKERPHTEEFRRLELGEDQRKPGEEINPLLVDDNWSHGERARYVTSGPRFLHWVSRHFPSCLSQPSAAHRALYPKIFDELTRPRPKADGSDPDLEPGDRPEFLLRDTGYGVLRGRLSQPTLVLWGDEDRVLDRAPDYLEIRTDGEFLPTTLSGVGHSPIIETRKKTANAYLDFLAALEASAPPP